MFLCDVKRFALFGLSHVRGYYKRGLKGNVIYVRNFTRNFIPDVREIPTPSQFEKYLHTVKDKYRFNETQIADMTQRYANKTIDDRLKFTMSAKYPYKPSSYIPDLSLRGNPQTEQLRLVPSRKDLELLSTRWRDLNLQLDDTLFVMHYTTPNWIDNFLKHGIDTRDVPPDINLGRLTVNQKGDLVQSRIRENGLYIAPINSLQKEHIIIQTKPRLISHSAETLQRQSVDPLESLFSYKDATIKDHIITPEEIVGSVVYRQNRWQYIPNAINPNNDKIKAVTPYGELIYERR